MLLSIIFFVLSGCGPNYIFDQKKDIQDLAWSYNDTLNFEIDIQDTLKIYNLYLDIEHSIDYPFQNIYTQIYTQFPSGKRIKERLPIDFSEKSGKWIGDCSNDICTLRVNIQKGAFFNALGKHKITVEQFMRDNPLKGIKSIALRIEETSNKRQ